MADSVLRKFIQGSPSNSGLSKGDKSEEVRRLLEDVSRRVKGTSDFFKTLKTDNKNINKIIKDVKEAQELNAKLSAAGKTLNTKQAATFLKLVKDIEKNIESELGTELDGKTLKLLLKENEKATLENAKLQRRIDKTSKEIGESSEAFFKENVKAISETGLSQDVGTSAFRAISPEASFIAEGFGLNISELLGGGFNRLFKAEADDLEDALALFSNGIDGAAGSIKDFVEAVNDAAFDLPQSGSSVIPQLGFNPSPRLGFDPTPQLGLDSTPQLGFDSTPQLGFNSTPQLGLDSTPRLGRTARRGNQTQQPDTPDVIPLSGKIAGIRDFVDPNSNVQMRAPVGGVGVGDDFFKGGQFLPKGFDPASIRPDSDKGISVPSMTMSNLAGPQDSMGLASRVLEGEFIEASEDRSFAMTDSVGSLEGEFTETSAAREEGEEDRHLKILEALDDIEDSNSSLLGKGGALGLILSGLSLGVTSFLSSIKGFLPAISGRTKGKPDSVKTKDKPGFVKTKDKPGFLGKVKEKGKSLLDKGKFGAFLKSGAFLKATGLGAFVARGVKTTDFGPLQEILFGLFKRASDAVTDSFNSGKEKVIGAFTNVKDSIVGTFNKGLDIFLGVAPQVDKVLTEKVDIFWDGFRFLVKEAVEGGIDLFNDPKAFFKKQVDDVSGFFSELGGVLGVTIGESLKNIEEKIRDELSKPKKAPRRRRSKKTVAKFVESKTAEQFLKEDTSIDSARAEGGSVHAGGSFLVNGRVPEVSSPATGGNIIPMGSNMMESAASLEGEIASAVLGGITESMRKETVEKASRAATASAPKSGSGGGASFSGRRNIDSSPIHTTDIGLLVIVGGGI